MVRSGRDLGVGEEAFSLPSLPPLPLLYLGDGREGAPHVRDLRDEPWPHFVDGRLGDACLDVAVEDGVNEEASCRIGAPQELLVVGLGGTPCLHAVTKGVAHVFEEDGDVGVGSDTGVGLLVRRQVVTDRWLVGELQDLAEGVVVAVLLEEGELGVGALKALEVTDLVSSVHFVLSDGR